MHAQCKGESILCNLDYFVTDILKIDLGSSPESAPTYNLFRSDIEFS